MEGRRLAVVTPCRDEEDHIELAVNAVAAQTQRPDIWIIVDDGSTDATPRLLADVAAKHDWVKIVSMPPRTTRVLGAGVVIAFNRGLEEINLADYDYISKLDMDVELAPTYYETLLDRMTEDPRLATTSGSTITENSVGEWVPERGSMEMSSGMAKVYRVTAFQEMGGLVPEVMWDGIDCHEFRILGWRARSYDDEATQIRTFRAMGSSDRGIFRGRRRHGAGQWYMGTDPVFMVASAVLRARDEPRVLGSANMLGAYLRAAATRQPRHSTRRFRRQLRRFQRESLVLGKQRAVERWESNRAVAWQGNRSAQVAYLVSQFPSMSHSFIANEVAALRDLGWQVTTFSVRGGDGDDGTVSLLDQPRSQLVKDAARLATTPRAAAESAVRAGLPGPRPRPVGAAYWAEAASLLRHLDDAGITHVHVHFANNAAEVARLAVTMDAARPQPRGLTWSFTLHGLWMHGMGRPDGPGWPRHQADRWGPLAQKVSQADGIVAVSQLGAVELQRLAQPRQPIQVVHVGVDTERFSPASGAVAPAAGHDLNVLYVGRFAPEKSLETLLRAVAGIPQAHLTLVGSGPEEAALRQVVSELELTDRVTWHGRASQEDLPALYRAVDVFAMSSLNEGIPTVLMEAMACGLPVVATEVGAIGELVTDGQTGMLVPSQDSGALGSALERLAGDAGLRERMGRAARARVVESFSLSGQARAMSGFLAGVMSVPDPAAAADTAGMPAQQETHMDSELRLPNQKVPGQRTP